MATHTRDTDYLAVGAGAGAAGMAFTDALIADSDADVIMVDRLGMHQAGTGTTTSATRWRAASSAWGPASPG